MTGIQSQIPINLSKAPRYVTERSKQLSTSPKFIQDFDINRLEGIQEGIDVFKGVSMKEIRTISQFLEVFNLKRGCVNACSHCLRNAQPPSGFHTILWDDFLRFINGFKQLNERLGFNILKPKETNNYLALFDDSNLPVFESKDLQGKSHFIKEAVSKSYEALNIPQSIVTAGWNKSKPKVQNSAIELSEYLQKNPDAVSELSVSINPFHKFMQQSRLAIKKGNPQEAQKVKEKYINSIVNAIEVFFPFFKPDSKLKANIIYRHSPDLPQNKGTDSIALKELYTEIYAELKNRLGERIKQVPALHPNILTKPSPNHLLEPKGRGRQFFSESDQGKHFGELFNIFRKWNPKIHGNEKLAKDAESRTLKGIDINGKAYLITSEETVIPTNIQLNFINKCKQTAQLGSDIEHTPILFSNKNEPAKSIIV